ncbi:type I DNA topoisomerase [Trueperella sp. LYQ143]|uniref:type I DNA topoisomerase n=1 Tax=Trueperella sp. LYQ143 TaxID=3391059 RepID=UPI003982F83F
MSKLVIVESPAKARTIGKYLGSPYVVEASVGHVRDLPRPSDLPAQMKKGPYKKFAVDVENGFEPYYVVSADKKKKVAELKKILKQADELYLATDEDREGEAIAWHLREVLKPKVPVKRMVFHEITQEAISRALDNTRDINIPLVDAQETRRILDRLYGYEVSPLLWRKIAPNLSAGRVQSVTTRLIVERERERIAFRPASYWDVTVTHDAAGESFVSKLVALDGRRIATGKDFDDDGQLSAKARGNNLLALTQADAQAVALSLADSQAGVASVETKPYRRRPPAPFTTSTLQQEASRKLRVTARETMRAAQSLYENGYITYMRTDSVNLSSQAIGAARKQAAAMYGARSVPEKPRIYTAKSKGAQEAHEAIRPAGESFRTPQELASVLFGLELKIYELIWRRTLASQMIDATGVTASVRLHASIDAAGARQAELAASGTVITEQGFLAAYQEGRDKKRYEDEAEGQLPELSVGQHVSNAEATAEGHQTTPPPRYTEASLVRTLEERGIGRPSTYASTISTIIDRGYVTKRSQALVPTFLAFAVVGLMENNLPQLVDYDFTAEMETELDNIAAGEQDRVAYLKEFYNGDTNSTGLHAQVDGLAEEIDARAANTLKLSDEVAIRIGRYGPYVERSNSAGEAVGRATIPDDVAPDELTLERALDLLENSGSEERELGRDPQTGYPIIVKNGRFGPYVTEVLPDDAVAYTATGKVSKVKPKPRTASLFSTMSPQTIRLEQALELLTLPREIGEFNGEIIRAQNGRYGPYITCGSESRSLESEEQIFTITVEEAQQLLSEPKKRRAAASRTSLKEFGADPVSGGNIVMKTGRFGPYVTDGTVNASIPRAEAANLDTITPERAQELLALRRIKIAESGGATKSSRTSAAKKGAAAKKGSTAKKASGSQRASAKKTTSRTAKTSRSARTTKKDA